MARRDKFTREMGELFNVVVDIMERSISGKYIYKKNGEYISSQDDYAQRLRD